MTKQEFKRMLTQGKPVYLDGATGSNLMKRGMPGGVCPEQWIMEHPQVLLGLQKEYVEAGAQIIYAPTFTANRVKLAEYGLADRIEEVNRRLVAISKEAAGERAFVAGDVTMTGQQLKPVGPLDFEELVTIYKEQIQYLAGAGADLLVIETMMSLQETRAALIAAKETCSLPVMATLTFEPDGRTLFGTDAKTAAAVLQSLGADAVGANCSTGPDKMRAIIEEMAAVSEIPLIAKPNAGLPALDAHGATVYDMPAVEFAAEMRSVVEAGAAILGGCCGTTPEYIAALAASTADMKVREPLSVPLRLLCSERRTVSISLDGPFLVVGERINPTGKKKLQQQLKEGSLEMACEFAEEQEEMGASVLDINMGMSGIDEKEMMLRAIDEVAMASSLPLSIDSSHVDIIEAALRRYPGRALINSISCETEKMEQLLPVAKKYGAMCILLPLSEAGLPKDGEEKRRLIHLLMDKALAAGLRKEDLVVDGLVTTVGANRLAAVETLETIRYCRQELSLATITGLSNISFGLPERGMVNAAFLTMAIASGLTMAIANPSQQLLMDSAFASDLLLAKEGADLCYIERMQVRSPAPSPAGAKVPAQPERQTVPAQAQESADGAPFSTVYEAVLKGNRKGILALTEEALSQGGAAAEILNQGLLPAIDKVGDLFDKGRYFLPQLIASAETMKTAIARLEPLLKEQADSASMPVVVIATVEGDIHDIGKNLVALMLKNHGFLVVDLGKDVPKERIIEAAREHDAAVIALSALMTTTMQQMRHVISYAKEQGLGARIIIGGAVTTQDYADEIGADGYSRDAAEAVRLVKKLCKL